MKGRDARLFLVSMTVAVATSSLLSAQDIARYPTPLSEQQLILIETSTQSIDLVANFPSSVARPPGDEMNPRLQDSFLVEVLTVLPEWGVSIWADQLAGPQAHIPANRIWVSTHDTQASFIPLDSPVSVLSGTQYDPVFTSDVAVTVHPDWIDAAGVYHGQLVLSPYVPENILAGSEYLFQGKDPGAAQQVQVQLVIPEVIELSITQAEITFDATGGPGTYQADQEISVRVSTNAQRWHIVAEASDFRHSEHPEWQIPLERVQWKLTSGPPMALDTAGSMAPIVNLFEGNTQVKEHEIKIYFQVQILPADRAGVYSMNINLMGKVSQ